MEETSVGLTVQIKPAEFKASLIMYHIRLYKLL